jgi:hypothetical protein
VPAVKRVEARAAAATLKAALRNGENPERRGPGPHPTGRHAGRARGGGTFADVAAERLERLESAGRRSETTRQMRRIAATVDAVVGKRRVSEITVPGATPS